MAIALDSAVWVPSGKVGAALPGAGIRVRVSALAEPLIASGPGRRLCPEHSSFGCAHGLRAVSKGST